MLLDNWMPDLSGIDLTREIRRAGIATPILFCSGAATPSDIKEALNAGAQGYLVKPLDLDELADNIEILIENRV